MRSIVRTLLLTAVGFSFVVALGGCGPNNEAGMEGTKGVAPANAPKSQAEFFKQQQELNKEAKVNLPSPKSK